ncbi:MAG: calcium/sodium antiporter [Rhodovibrionaceae bacterium]
MIYLQLLGGLVLLVLGGDALVRGAVAVARRFGVSPLLIGLTLVGFGTSTPELVTSLQAAFLGSPGIAIGNVIGSNTANILLILGVAAVIFPVATARDALLRDGGAVLFAALAAVAIVLHGELFRSAGAILVVLLLAYVLYSYLRERRSGGAAAAMHEGEVEIAEPGPKGLPLALLFAFGGIALTILGADLLVKGAIHLASAAGISETLLGLTIVAVGTSLPELVTSVAAALRRHGDIAFGNVLGSNIYNVLGILGVTALVKPIPVPVEIAGFDVWVMLGATLLLLVFAATGQRISRWEGAALLAGYGAYLAVLAILAPAAA